MSTVPKYNEDLRAPVQTEVGDAPKVKVHRMEWSKVRASWAVAVCRHSLSQNCSCCWGSKDSSTVLVHAATIQLSDMATIYSSACDCMPEAIPPSFPVEHLPCALPSGCLTHLWKTPLLRAITPHQHAPLPPGHL